MNELLLRVVAFLQTGWTDATDKNRDRGATAVEYGLMVALIAIVIIGAVTLLGDNLSGLFNDTADAVGS